MSTNVTFFETNLFSLPSPVTSSPVTSLGEDDDLLMYTIASPVLTLAPVPVKPPITQVYSRRQSPLASSPTPAASLSNLVQNDDLPIALRKGKR